MSDPEPGTEIIPERYSQLVAGLAQPEERIAAIPTHVGARAGADLAPDDLSPDVVLGSVGVQWDLGALQHPQQLRLVRPQPSQQPIEGGKAGSPREDPVKARSQLHSSAAGWCLAIELQIAVEPPHQHPHAFLGGALMIREGVELMDQTLGMHPAQ